MHIHTYTYIYIYIPECTHIYTHTYIDYIDSVHLPVNKKNVVNLTMCIILQITVCQHLITVRLHNAEGVPPENSQRHALEQEITLTLILESHGMSATQIVKKQDSRFPHGAGRLDRNCLEDEASAQLSVLSDFPDFSGDGDGSSGERGSY